jgi:enamine deaminase RidA (YjgF/YER057c/UK114 family)
MSALAENLETIAHAPIAKRAITNHGVLNEAYAYAKPSSFSRGIRIDSNGVATLFQEQGLDPVPASTGIQAHLCRPELLIEIEAIAIFRTDRAAAGKR